MNKVFSISIVCLLLSCQHQLDRVEAIDLVFDSGRYLYNGQIYSGIAIDCYEGGALNYEKTFVNGKLHGKYSVWYANGQLKESRYYRKGYKVGTHKGFWSDGNKKFLCHYDNKGRFSGLRQEWYKNGQLYLKFQYEKGKEVGLQQMFTASGKIIANYEVKFGERFGLIARKKCTSDIE